MTRVIGTCGLCHGPVEVPVAWMGTQPVVPSCRLCGATVVSSHGPALPMNPAPKRYDLDHPWERRPRRGFWRTSLRGEGWNCKA